MRMIQTVGKYLLAFVAASLALAVTARATETVVSVTQYSYTVDGQLDCTAVRMNVAAATADACTLGPDGGYGPDRIVKNVYDKSGNLIEVKRAYGVVSPQYPVSYEQIYATYTYTKNGLKASEIDARGNVTRYAYDGFDRLSSVYYPAALPVQSYQPCSATPETYTGYSSCTQPYTARITNNSTKPTVAMSSAAQCTGATDCESFGYDANSRKTSWRRRDGNVIAYVYDNLNRVTVEDQPAVTGMQTATEKDVYTTYDLASHVLAKRFQSATNTQGVFYVHDSFGRVVSTTDFNGRQVAYRYNQASARTRLTFPEGNYIDTSLMDRANRTLAASWNGSGVMYSQAFDSLGRRKKLLHPGNIAQSENNDAPCISINSSTCYSYDAFGRLTGLTNNVYDSPSPLTNLDITWTFQKYTPAGQLASWAASSSAYDYVETTTSTEARSFDGLNRDTTLAVSGICPSGGYDARGNVICNNVRNFKYDLMNRLLTATGSGANLKLVYDPEGRLAKYSADGGSTYKTFLYDGINMIGTYDTAGAVAEQYIFGPDADQPLVWFNTTNGVMVQRHLWANYQGSIIAYTNQAGLVGQIYKYSPYGEPLVSTISTPDVVVSSFAGAQFRYTGQTVLPEAGLYYYKARIYDPGLGRFLQTDPIGSKDDLNLYAYAAGDPINKSDPTGLAGFGKSLSITQCGQALLAQAEALRQTQETLDAAYKLQSEQANVRAGRQRRLSDGSMVTAFKIYQHSDSFGYVHDKELTKFIQGLEQDKLVLSDNVHFTYELESSNPLTNRYQKSSAAVTTPGWPVIYLADNFFTSDFAYQVETVDHEPLHIFGKNAFDRPPESYGPDKAHGLNNADTYSQIIKECQEFPKCGHQ